MSASDDFSAMGKGVIVLTYACNLKCSFCYAGYEVFDSPKTMKVSEAFRSIDFLKSIGITTFTLLGGEPTVHGKLREVIEYARDSEMRPWIITNGVRLSDATYATGLVDAGLTGGCISFHGHTAELHDGATRSPGSFGKACSALRIAVKEGWPIYPMLTVMAPQLESVVDAVAVFTEVGCETVFINFGLPNIKSDLDTGIDVGPRELASLTEALYRSQDELGVRFIFNREKNKIPLCFFDYELLKDMFAKSAIGVGCEASEGSTVVIEPGGSVLGCSHWVDHQLLNIYANKESLELLPPEEFWRLWGGGRAKAFRDEMRFFPFEECEDCGWREAKMCFGGCKVWQAAGSIPKTVAFHGKTVERYEEGGDSKVTHTPDRTFIPIGSVGRRPYQPR